MSAPGGSRPLSVERDGPVTLLTLDRQDAANAITPDMAVAVAEAIDTFTTDDRARVLVVTGAGERSFCAGGDLAHLHEITEHPHADRAGPLGFARLDPGKPTIAAVNGHCFGGGLELAVWCDFRIAADNAVFGALNRQWGVTLIDGGTQRLPRIIGHGNAMWMIARGCRVDAAHAERIGLIQERVPTGHARARALHIAHELAALPQSALVADRAGVVAGSDLSLADGLDTEARLGRAVMSESDVLATLADYRAGHRPPQDRAGNQP